VAGAAFVLCAVTSLVCLALLVRSYRVGRTRLVLWCAICFAGLAVTNVLLAVNELIVPSVHMHWRGIPATVGLWSLVYGLVREELASRPRGPKRRALRGRSGVGV
jgi:hypothetical protein